VTIELIEEIKFKRRFKPNWSQKKQKKVLRSLNF
jgi:hypothetical protein